LIPVHRHAVSHLFILSFSSTEIAEACFDPEGYRQVFGVLARRLQESVRLLTTPHSFFTFFTATPETFII
jgi:hypothetical protein